MFLSNKHTFYLGIWQRTCIFIYLWVSVVSPWQPPAEASLTSLSVAEQPSLWKVGLCIRNGPRGTLPRVQLGGLTLCGSVKCSSLMRSSAHVCFRMFVRGLYHSSCFFQFFLFLIQHLPHYEPLKQRIQLVYTNAIFITHSTHFYKTCYSFYSHGQLWVRHLFFKRAIIWKPCIFLWLAFTRPALAVGLHPISDIPAGHVSMP